MAPHDDRNERFLIRHMFTRILQKEKKRKPWNILDFRSCTFRRVCFPPRARAPFSFQRIEKKTRKNFLFVCTRVSHTRKPEELDISSPSLKHLKTFKRYAHFLWWRRLLVMISKHDDYKYLFMVKTEGTDQSGFFLWKNTKRYLSKQNKLHIEKEEAGWVVKECSRTWTLWAKRRREEEGFLT